MSSDACAGILRGVTTNENGCFSNNRLSDSRKVPVYVPGLRLRVSILSQTCLQIPAGKSSIPLRGNNASARMRNPKASTKMASCSRMTPSGSPVTATDTARRCAVALVTLNAISAHSPASRCGTRMAGGLGFLLNGRWSAQGLTASTLNGARPVAARKAPMTAPVRWSSGVKGIPL